MDGDALKQIGLNLVSAHNEDFLAVMRAHARVIAMEQGEVTTDDLQAYAARIGLEPQHPNAWGAIFRQGEGFKKIGYRKSRRPKAHARMISVWGI